MDLKITRRGPEVKETGQVPRRPPAAEFSGTKLVLLLVSGITAGDNYINCGISGRFWTMDKSGKPGKGR